MSRRVSLSLAGTLLLLALAGCGRSFLQFGERPAWRHDEEVACLKSGSVKIGVGIEQMKPIEGPGMCGADFPLKVALLGEGTAMSYGDDLRPPGAIPNAQGDQPRWPPLEQRYAPAQGGQMRWVPGPPPAVRPAAEQPAPYEPAPYTPVPQRAAPQAPAGQPLSIYAPGVRQADDIPDDAQLPPGRDRMQPAYQQQPPVQQRQQPAYNAPVYQPPPQRAPPALGPTRGNATAAMTPAAVTPPATLACPMVSALDRWVSDGVQPAALHWFGSQVTEIRQIGSYSCREMVGSGTSSMSEHAFGDALDVAGFTLADGRKITVKDGWHGTPEEQGFLHDVQLYACQTFTTVLAPGYNVYHYDHIHVDLMRRREGYRPCRPDAIPGEVVAARARAVYAAKHGAPAYTGAIAKASAKARKLPVALPGEDGFVADADDDVTGSVGVVHRTGKEIDHDFDAEKAPAAPVHRSAAAANGDAAIRAEEMRTRPY
ncbi:MAG TPA: extensin family protein [Pseudolabrys sp.]|nr:extensin family protein [Pseudolabrys sp.]